MRVYLVEKAAVASIPMERETEVDADTITAKVLQFLSQFIGDRDIDPDLDLFESGLLNSLFAMQLLLFVEQEFGVNVTNEDLDIKNFNSLNAVTGFVLSKLAASE